MSEQFSENIKTSLILNDIFSERSEDESKIEDELSGTFGNAFKNSFPFNIRINEDNENEDFKIKEYYIKDTLELNLEKSLTGMKETNSETKKGLLIVNKSPLAFDKSLSIMEKIHANESYKGQNSYLNEKCFNELNSSEDKLDTKKFTSKKRGRHEKSCSNIVKASNASSKTHDKNSMDNLLSKIHVDFFNFIISYANDILKEFNYDEKFLNLAHDYKNQVKKDFVDSLKEKTISDIICTKITCKYQTKDENTNKIIYEKIKENEVLKNIFDEKFLALFDVYYKGQKTINLKKYGLEKVIHLSNETKTFKDLLKKNESDEEYIKNLKNCVNINYVEGIRFLVY